MKKCNRKATAKATLVALLILLVSLCAACEGEENAKIIVRNELGGDVVELTLTGDEDTGDLLDGKSIPEGTEEMELPVSVAPGKYLWHAVTGGDDSATFDAPTEIELFPGPNNVLLRVDAP